MPKTQMDLAEGPIFKKILLFSLPILLGAIVTELYNVVDSIIVGQFIGANALAAVSASSPSASIINMFLVGLQTGSSVVVAQKMGSRDRQHMNDAISTITSLTLLSSLIIIVGGVIAAKPILRGLNTPAEIFDDAAIYMTVIFIGAAGNLIYNIGSGVLRGLGDSTWPFLFLVLCAVLNLALDLVAVLILDIGVAGVALATAIAQFVSGVGIVIRLNTSNYGAKVDLKHLRIVKPEAMLLGSVALPAAVQNIGNTLAALFMQSYVNSFGANFAAANNIVTKLESFTTIPIAAVSAAVCTFTAQNIGRGQVQRVHKGINQSNLFLCGLGCMLCAGMYLLRDYLPYAFTTEQEVVITAARGIGIMCFVCTFNGFDRVLLNAMRAAGRSIVPMITAQFGCFSRIFFGWLLAVRTGNSDGIFYSLLLAAFARMAAIAVYYYIGSGKHAIDRCAARALEQDH